MGRESTSVSLSIFAEKHQGNFAPSSYLSISQRKRREMLWKSLFLCFSWQNAERVALYWHLASPSVCETTVLIGY